MTRINTNVSSLVAQNTLGRSNAALNQALTRLSTGLRINTGKDDPAGLIASENLRSDITSIKKAITNTDRANQVIATADSALGQVSGLLNDIRGLVTEAANTGALSDEQIAANQLQVDSSLEALNRIAQTTTFQGRRLLDGSLDFITVAGNGFGTVTDLKIDQANLGATGQVAVNVDVTAAATQASITNTGVPAGSGSGVQASGTLTFGDDAVPSSGAVALSAVSTAPTAGTGSTTFTVETVAEVLASGTSPALTNGGTLTVTAISGGIAGGATGNTFDLDLIDGAGTPGGVDSVVLNGTTIEVTADLTGGAVDLDAIVAAIDAHDFGSGVGNDFAASATLGASFAVAADAAAPRLTLGGGVSQVTVNAQLDITADAALGAGTTTVQFTTAAQASDILITGTAESTITVSLDASTDITLDDIATALSNYAGIDTASFVSNGTETFNSDNDSTPANASVTGGTNAVSTTQTINITGVDGEASNIDFQIVESASVLTGTPVVSGNATDGYVVSVSSTANTTVADIASAIQGLAEIQTASYGGSATYEVGVNTGLTGAGISTSLTGGLDAADDVITIASDTAGTAANGVSVTIIEATSHGATPTAAFNGANIEVTVDDAINTSVAAIVQAINDLDGGYTATHTSGAGNGLYAGGLDTVSPATLANGAAPGGLDSAVVLEISGASGAEVLSFGAGSSLSQVVAGINGVSDATGVSASTDSGNLVLTSTGYGSAALVSVNVLDGDTNNTFVNGLNTNRDTGTDIVATVNGIAATGTGNSLYVNTATLDLTIAVEEGSATDVNFTISGGGALFQLGPDVVSNQQARIGITSVNTAKLGGVSGKLFQLGSGGTAALVDDTNTAGKIVEEAINQVTSLRGRLGAFQRTTLETNKQALNDTLVNLTEAESQIRDSDFAEETAALTRGQILVQSGTVVLQISNQNPQNVLALLQR